MTTTDTRPAPAPARERASAGTGRTVPVADEAWLAGAAPPDERPAGGRVQRGATRPPARPKYELRTRKPVAGSVWPFVLLTGGDFSGKTTQIGRAAESERFGRTWVLPFGEDPDQIAEYDPDAMVVEHDGSLYEFASAVEQVAKVINAEPLVDGKPQLVAVDSGSVLWDLHAQLAEARARNSSEVAAELMRDPYAQINIGPLNWAAVNRMWLRIIRQLKSMQAVVVMTARGKDGVVIDPHGRIDNKAAGRGESTYRVAVQSETPFEAHAFIKLDRHEPPQILGVRAGKRGLCPGVDEPIVCDGKPRIRNGREVTYPVFSLEWLVFDLLRLDPATARTAVVVDPKAEPDDTLTTRPASNDAAAVTGADEAPGRQRPVDTVPAPGR